MHNLILLGALDIPPQIIALDIEKNPCAKKKMLLHATQQVLKKLFHLHVWICPIFHLRQVKYILALKESAFRRCMGSWGFIALEKLQCKNSCHV